MYAIDKNGNTKNILMARSWRYNLELRKGDSVYAKKTHSHVWWNSQIEVTIYNIKYSNSILTYEMSCKFQWLVPDPYGGSHNTDETISAPSGQI